MKKAFVPFVMTVLLSLSLVDQGFGLDADGIARMHKSGINSETIELIIHEKIIETCAFTVDDLIALKRAGLKNDALQTVIRSASFMKDSKPIIYGDETRQLRSMTIQDIVSLKKAGISDEAIQAIVSGEMSEENEEYRRAWKMLEDMDLIVDDR
jgi:hypothetical protein